MMLWDDAHINVWWACTRLPADPATTGLLLCELPLFPCSDSHICNEGSLFLDGVILRATRQSLRGKALCCLPWIHSSSYFEFKHVRYPLHFLDNFCAIGYFLPSFSIALSYYMNFTEGISQLKCSDFNVHEKLRIQIYTFKISNGCDQCD